MTWAFIIPIIGIIALLVAAGLAANVKKQSEGTDRMKEIAAAIHEGARAFLFAEYKILAIIIVIVFVAVGFAIGWTTALCFLIGAFFSIIAGFCGMTVATRANVRTANAAKEKGMAAALSVAFRGGAVMGLCVVGLGLFGVRGFWNESFCGDVSERQAWIYLELLSEFRVCKCEGNI